MKEKAEQNEKFVSFHEEQLALGKSLEEIKQLAITEFSIGGSDPTHTYRAWRCRLADPKKYAGAYSERMKPFMRAKNNTKEVVKVGVETVGMVIEAVEA